MRAIRARGSAATSAPATVTRPAERRDEAEQRAKERGLAGAVGAEHAQHFARFEREVQAAADGASRIAEGERARRGSWGAPRRRGEERDEDGRADDRGDHAGRQLAEDAVRHSVSTTSRNAAPRIAEIGSTRAKLGPASRPRGVRHDEPHPADDAGDRDRGRGRQRRRRDTTTRRDLATSTPSARASSSGSESRLMRQRSSASGTKPAAMSGNAIARSRGSTPAKLPSSQNVIAGSWL